MNKQRGTQLAQNFNRLGSPLGGVRRNPGIERLPGAHGLVKGTHGFFQIRVWIKTMRVENIDVVDAHARERLVETCEQIFTGTANAGGAGPPIPTSLG